MTPMCTRCKQAIEPSHAAVSSNSSSWHCERFYHPLCLAKSRREERYNLPPGSIDLMLEAQDGRCSDCRRPFNADLRNMHVDHDHTCCPRNDNLSKRSCGKCVRGLVDSTCNSIRGVFDAYGRGGVAKLRMIGRIVDQQGTDYLYRMADNLEGVSGDTETATLGAA